MVAAQTMLIICLGGTQLTSVHFMPIASGCLLLAVHSFALKVVHAQICKLDVVNVFNA